MRIDELRRRWDPRMAERIESHVTVLYETLAPADLERLVRATPPLRLRAGEVERWTTEPGIFVAVRDPDDDLRHFRIAALGTDDTEYRPHITLLHRESVTSALQAEEAWTALRSERFDADFAVTELVVYEEIGGSWRVGARPRFGERPDGRRYRARAIVFDLDGVLVDSMPAIRAYWTDWAGRHEQSAEAVLAELHLTAEELVRRFAPTLDPVAEARATAEGQARMETGITPFEGALALIDRLSPNSWAVVTSGRRALALRHLELGRLPVPNVLVTAEDTPRGKPDPAGFVLAAERLGIPPRECLAIEDSPAGVRAARDAGMTVIGVTNTHPARELAQADAVIDSLVSLRLTADHESLPLEVVLSRSARR